MFEKVRRFSIYYFILIIELPVLILKCDEPGVSYEGLISAAELLLSHLHSR